MKDYIEIYCECGKEAVTLCEDCEKEICEDCIFSLEGVEMNLCCLCGEKVVAGIIYGED